MGAEGRVRAPTLEAEQRAGCMPSSYKMQKGGLCWGSGQLPLRDMEYLPARTTFRFLHPQQVPIKSTHRRLTQLLRHRQRATCWRQGRHQTSSARVPALMSVRLRVRPRNEAS